MAIIVVGGSGRNVGKTSVVAGLIAAMPHMRWTAIKLTPHAHGEHDPGDEPVTVTEETDPNSGTDSSRFLAAGAVRSFWVRARIGNIADAMPLIRKELEQTQNAIFESNSVLQFLRPDLYLAVVNSAPDDFKDSVKLYLSLADAVLAPEHMLKGPRWKEVSSTLAERTPVLPMRPPVYVTEEIARFVRERIIQ